MVVAFSLTLRGCSNNNLFLCVYFRFNNHAAGKKSVRRWLRCTLLPKGFLASHRQLGGSKGLVVGGRVRVTLVGRYNYMRLSAVSCRHSIHTA